MTLRDIYGSNDDKPIILNHEPVGNGGGLGSFHTVNPEDREPNNTPKIIGGLAVALMLGAAGAYVYSVSGHQPKQVVAANSLPAPSAPAPAAAPAPMSAPQPAAMTPAPDATPAPTPSADTSSKPESKPVVRTASVKKTETKSDMSGANARMNVETSTPAPQQQAVAVPEPVSPQAPTSSLAANTAPQPAAEAAPQAAQSSTPQATPMAPAQDQQTGATPAPAQQAEAATPAPATTPAQPAQSTQQ